MPIKLLLAEPAKGRESAKLRFEFYEDVSEKHQVNFFKDAEGNWWPELKITLSTPPSEDIAEVLTGIVATLHQAAYVLETEAHSVADMAKWLK